MRSQLSCQFGNWELPVATSPTQLVNEVGEVGEVGSFEGLGREKDKGS